MKDKVFVSWSGGKDSAYALYEILQSPQYQVVGLLTTLVEDTDRVKMHGVRTALLEAQAKSIGLPLITIPLSENSGNTEYEMGIFHALRVHRYRGAKAIVFGDLFLEDIKNYRDACLKKWEMQGIYPLWKKDTTALAQEMIRVRLKTIVTCVDTKVLDPSFAGRLYNEAFLKDLPLTVDPCGENGEFHTFVYDGPYFHHSIPYHVGEEFVKEERFYYRDLIHGERVNGLTSVRVTR